MIQASYFHEMLLTLPSRFHLKVVIKLIKERSQITSLINKITNTMTLNSSNTRAGNNKDTRLNLHHIRPIFSPSPDRFCVPVSLQTMT